MQALKHEDCSSYYSWGAFKSSLACLNFQNATPNTVMLKQSNIPYNNPCWNDSD